MKLIHDIEDPGSLREIVAQDLKEIGIKFPKHKKSKTKEELLDDGGVFGTQLRQVPCLLIDNFGMVPRFLVEATSVLEQHLDLEGIFRKSGSVARQKELKDRIELGDELKEGHPYDVASLIKQFFRELPDPLLTAKLHDTFLKVNALETEGQRHVALMLLCLLLPLPHLTTLRFIMCFLSRVAHHSASNKMETSNLAVCMAPNLLHNSAKAEKINSESKLLHAQTNIVHLLICHAQEIGMVADELYERTCLYGCFQSEDELERSEDLNESKPKKKKKRSGSLQGLVNNLSSSFSKWRKDGRGHNSSSLSDKSSMMSYTSYDQVDVTVTSQTSDDVGPDMRDVMLSDVTPKVMRKRKASGEMVPFSASKKKAILQNMPQMATLGNTPFTPVAKRHAEGSGSMVFNATPTPATEQTPRRRMDKLISPGSATKVKRHTTSTKSGCFSPKTTKSGKRKSFKGFLRRLSGGKDSPASSTAPDLSGSGVGKRLAYPGCPPEKLIILPPTSDKKKGMFRRHNKTPSSPARLLVPVEIDVAACEDCPDVGDEDEAGARNHKRGFSSDCGVLKRGRPNTVRTGLPVPNRRSLDRSLPVPVRHSSQKEINLSPERATRLEPNALDTSPIARVEPDEHEYSPGSSPGSPPTSSEGSGEDEAGKSPVRAKGVFRPPTGETPMGGKQTSSASLNGLDYSHLGDASMLEEDHDRAFIHDSTMMGDNINTDDHHGNNPNNITTTAAHPSGGDSNVEEFKKPSGLPRWRDNTTSSTNIGENSTSGAQQLGANNTTRSADQSVENDSADVLNETTGSEVSDDSSVCTIIYNGQPVSSKPSVAKPPLLKPRSASATSVNVPSESESGLHSGKVAGAKLEGSRDKYKSASSLDSGIDPEENPEQKLEQGSLTGKMERKLEHSPSVGSMRSVDSGLDCDMEGVEEQQSDSEKAQEGVSVVETKVAPLVEEAGSVSAFSRNVARAQSFRASKEGAKPVLLSRSESMSRPAQAKRNPTTTMTMPVSAEMHHMLSRVGVVGSKAEAVSSAHAEKLAPFRALPTQQKDATENLLGQDPEAPTGVRESVLNLQEAAVVSNNVKELSTKLDKELVDKRASPLRFTNSVTRNRGVSPVRIPTIFAKADSEALKYKQLVTKALLKSPAKPASSGGSVSGPSSRSKPILPISTNLVRNDSVECAKKRLNVGPSVEERMAHRSSAEMMSSESDAGSTPVKPLSMRGNLQTIDINQSLLETIEQCCTPTGDRLRKNNPGTDMADVNQELSAALRDSTNTAISGSAGSEAVPSTPQIKSVLLNSDMKSRLLAKGLCTPRGASTTVGATETPGRRYRSPVKPVKRLQGSPRSPRASAVAKSPHKFNMASTTSPGGTKVSKRGALSPIPNHVTDWNI